MPANVAQKIDIVELVEPVGIVAHDGVAAGVFDPPNLLVRLVCADSDWLPLARGTTNADGRANDLLRRPGAGALPADLRHGRVLPGGGRGGLLPEVSVTFVVEGGEEHYHVPLLLSPFGYSTYRGS